MQASIQSRLAGAMREQGMRSLLLADPENFGYVAGPMLPYVKQTPDRAVLALFEPGTDEAACTCWLYPDLAQPAEAQRAELEALAVQTVHTFWQQGADLLALGPRRAVQAGTNGEMFTTKNACPEIRADVHFLGF